MTNAGPKKLEFLDALRGWAILLVLVVHCALPSELFGFKLALAKFGQRGVQLFYEVSAFSLLYSLYERRDPSWANFFLRRFFRIAPLFYLSIVANVVVGVLILKQAPLPFLGYLAGFTFLFGFHPSTINSVAPAAWSIAVESSFYVVFPLLASRIRNLGSALAFMLLAMLGCFTICDCFRPAILVPLPEEYVQFLWFPVEFPVFCMGFVAFFLWRDLFGEGGSAGLTEPRYARVGGHSRKVTSLVLLLVGAAIAVASFPPSNYRLYPSSLSFIFFILALALQPWRALVNPAIATIGRLSFSIYLVHPYLLGLVRGCLLWTNRKVPGVVFGSYLGVLEAFALLLGGSLLISRFTYRYIELPGIAWGKRWVIRRTAKAAASDATTSSSLPMEAQSKISTLQSRLRLCYAGWIVSALVIWTLATLYHNHDRESPDRPTAQYQAEIAAYKQQIDILSAETLKDQRVITDTQQQLTQTNEDYKRAIETIKQMQASGH